MIATLPNGVSHFTRLSIITMVKSVGKYDLYKTLGQGSFGKVKYAVNRETNEAVAIKILDKDKIQKKNMGKSFFHHLMAFNI
jgi:serine/threonine protein kinase